MMRLGPRMRGALIIVSAMLLTSPAVAQVCQTVPQTVMGQGTLSCGRYLSAEEHERRAIDIWVLGFVSGANIFAGKFGQVGGNTDNAGLLYAVRMACSSDPEKAVYQAATAYIGRRTAHCR